MLLLLHRSVCCHILRYIVLLLINRLKLMQWQIGVVREEQFGLVGSPEDFLHSHLEFLLQFGGLCPLSLQFILTSPQFVQQITFAFPKFQDFILCERMKWKMSLLFSSHFFPAACRCYRDDCTCTVFMLWVNSFWHSSCFLTHANISCWAFVLASSSSSFSSVSLAFTSSAFSTLIFKTKQEKFR